MEDKNHTLFLFAPIHRERTEQNKNWALAPGIVLKRENLRDFKVRIYYSYTVEDKLYRGNNLYRRSHGDYADVGDEVTVWYNPDKPSASSFHKPGRG